MGVIPISSDALASHGFINLHEQYRNFERFVHATFNFTMPNLAIEALLLQQNWQVARPHLDNEIPNVVSSSDQFFSGNSSNSMQGGSDGASSASLSPPISTSRRTRKGRKSTSPKLDSNANTKSSAKGSKKYVCQTCGRSFDYKHVLQNHERTHTGEKPFTCTQCKKKFTRDHHLKTHMRLHTGEKPYKCEHCPKDFVQVANLRRHTRVHTGERPYDCKICPSRFSDSNQLKAHVLIHSGEKPFECIKCHHPFRRRHHLNGHNCPELLKAKAKAKAEIPLKIDNVDLPTMSHLSTMSLHFQSINGPLNLTVDHVQTEPVDLSVRGSISNSFDL